MPRCNVFDPSCRLGRGHHGPTIRTPQEDESLPGCVASGESQAAWLGGRARGGGSLLPVWVRRGHVTREGPGDKESGGWLPPPPGERGGAGAFQWWPLFRCGEARCAREGCSFVLDPGTSCGQPARGMRWSGAWVLLAGSFRAVGCWPQQRDQLVRGPRPLGPPLRSEPRLGVGRNVPALSCCCGRTWEHFVNLSASSTRPVDFNFTF